MSRFHQRFQFQPKANVPMTIETRDRCALQIRMAGETLIASPNTESYNVLAKMFASLNRAGLAEVVDPGARVMHSICDRYEQMGAINVEPEEAACLRQTIANADAAIHRIPLQRFAKAVAEVEVFCFVTDPADKKGQAMKFGTANPASTELYRADTHAHPPIVLRRKRCACGKVVTAKQLAQQGSCNTCVRGKAGVEMPRAA